MLRPFDLVFLTDGRGNAFEVALINTLDRSGSAMVPRKVGRDLSRLQHVIVRDSRGHIVLTGSLAPAPPAG